MHVRYLKGALITLLKTIVALMITALVACWAVPCAYKQRGYPAVGGEALLVLTVFVLSLWLLCRDFRKMLRKFRKEKTKNA